MSTTQNHLPIADIKDDILFLKNGGGAMVMQVNAVNFGLLSQEEQIAIISSFAQMLNSLSFSIQILIRSERLDISSYATLLSQALARQANPLLAQIMRGYINFIQATIKENEVLDKNFYIVIPLYSLELGLTPSKEDLEKKIKTVLIPRRDQISRQLGRIGLRASQLTSEKLLRLFYEIYNETEEKIELAVPEPVKLNTPQTPQNPAPAQTQQANLIQPILQTNPLRPLSVEAGFAGEAGKSKSHPFVVEELEDNV